MFGGIFFIASMHVETEVLLKWIAQEVKEIKKLG